MTPWRPPEQAAESFLMTLRALAPLCLLLLAPAALLLRAPAPPAGGDWWSWRGPDGSGMAEGTAPLHWSEADGIRWKRRIPGRGCSTPILVGDRIFLTTAVSTGRPASEQPPPPAEPEGDGDSEKAAANEGFLRGRAEGRFGEQRFGVLCISKESGELLWATEVARAWPHQGHHAQFGSYASRSVVTDGEHVYASFGSWGIYCLDLEGKLVWEADPGVKLEIRHNHGEGSGPVLHGDLLVHTFDHEGDSFVAAFDTANGEERWRTARDEPTSWSQPIVVEVDGEPQVVVAGENAMRGYELATGKELWQGPGLGRAVIATPVHGDGVVVGMTNYLNKNVTAIRLGGEGELPEEDVLWSSKRGASYTGTPLLDGHDLYITDDQGFISCFDLVTGEAHYREKRLPVRGAHLKASPLGVDGRIYLATEEGKVLVLALTPEKIELLALNEFEGEEFIASPVAVDGELFLRSMKFLYCIEGGDPPEEDAEER